MKLTDSHTGESDVAELSDDKYNLSIIHKIFFSFIILSVLSAQLSRWIVSSNTKNLIWDMKAVWESERIPDSYTISVPLSSELTFLLLPNTLLP